MVSLMAFRIRKKSTGNQEIKQRKKGVVGDQSNEQAKRQELAEWDAIAESAKHRRGESEPESVDDDG
jgi:hypothetical protein